MNNQMDVDEFIAHFGRKGMKWGVQSPHQLAVESGRTRSTSKKVGIAGGAILGSMVAARFTQSMVRKHPETLGVASIVGAASAVVGARAVRSWVDQNSSTPVSRLRGAHLSDKKLTRGEKGYLGFVGISALASTGLMVAVKQINA